MADKNTFFSKLRRLITCLLPVDKTRTGECRNCGACCELPYPCPMLRYENGTSRCLIYAVRPPSCRRYPRTPAEHITVAVCGYSFRSNGKAPGPAPVAGQQERVSQSN